VGGVGVLLVLVVGLFLGADPRQLLEMVSAGAGPSASTGGGAGAPVATGAPTDEASDFVAAVLGDTEDTWATLFSRMGRRYEPATLVLFRDAVDSACGYATAAVGPFYCPGDRKVYLDLSFFADLSRRFGAPGDFAQAYVIAHEVGHHVQTLLGISREVAARKRTVGEAEANALSVRQELQADCYSGLWAGHADRARDILERGDVEEGLRAAAAIGDDTLQRRGRGRVQPETFTHGTSAQRVRWFRRGLAADGPDACDTFATGPL